MSGSAYDTVILATVDSVSMEILYCVLLVDCVTCVLLVDCYICVACRLCYMCVAYRLYYRVCYL